MIALLSLLLAVTPGPAVPATRSAPTAASLAAKGTPKAQPQRISLAASEGGVVRVRLALAPNGTPTACTIVKSVAPALDRATCEGMMDRARFEPAAGEAGAASTERSVAWWR